MAEHIAYFEADEGVSRDNFNSRIEQINTAMNNAESEKGAAGGIATLDSNGKVTAAQASAAIGYCTANKTLTADDMGKLIVCYSSALTVTIPAGMPQGTEVEIVRWGNTAVTIAAASGTTLKSSATARTIKNQYGVVSLKRISSSTDDWLLVGDLG